MARKSLKRKAPAVVVDDLKLTLFDLEEDRTPVNILVHIVSADKRRIAHDAHVIQVDGKHGLPLSDILDLNLSDYFLPDFADLDIEEFQAAKKSTKAKASRKKRYISSVSNLQHGSAALLTSKQDLPLKNWYPLRNEYLNELLCLEGREGYMNESCLTCTSSEPRGRAEYRCGDCFQPQLRCKTCILAAHADTLFHRVYVSPSTYLCSHVFLQHISQWRDGKCFQKTTLKDLGLRIQLGHHPGDHCANPVTAGKKMVVVHTNSIHPAAIDYCGCDQAAAAGNQRQQLLRF